MKEVVLATGNPGKVVEMQATLESFGYVVKSQSKYNFPEAVEDGLSFVENAIIKARHACQLTGLPAIADDSGLEVSALDGAPGIYSSRYAGEQCDDQANNHKLLAALQGQANRSASFRCVIVKMNHANDPTPLICQGIWHGEIATEARGDNGFGYDPIFYLPELDCHSAQLTSEQKKKLSHRGKALAELQRQLSEQTT